MEKNTIIQIDSKNILDKALHGCVGFIKEFKNEVAIIAIYHPKDKGKNAFKQEFEIPINNLNIIGRPKLKPL